MDKLALACVCVVKAYVMKFLPDLGRLSLARPTGMQANAYASAQDEVTTLADLMSLILTLTKKGDFRAACDAARDWGATHTGARDNPALWMELAGLVFRPINPDVHLLTQADLNAGLDPRKKRLLFHTWHRTPGTTPTKFTYEIYLRTLI